MKRRPSGECHNELLQTGRRKGKAGGLEVESLRRFLDSHVFNFGYNCGYRLF